MPAFSFNDYNSCRKFFIENQLARQWRWILQVIVRFRRAVPRYFEQVPGSDGWVEVHKSRHASSSVTGAEMNRTAKTKLLQLHNCLSRVFLVPGCLVRS